MAKKQNSQKSIGCLLEAAIEVFAEKGPNAATVDEICNKAGLNKRMLYHYFGSKEKRVIRLMHRYWCECVDSEFQIFLISIGFQCKRFGVLVAGQLDEAGYDWYIYLSHKF